MYWTGALHSGCVAPSNCATTFAVVSASRKFAVTVYGRPIGNTTTAFEVVVSPDQPANELPGPAVAVSVTFLPDGMKAPARSTFVSAAIVPPLIAVPGNS